MYSGHQSHINYITCINYIKTMKIMSKPCKKHVNFTRGPVLFLVMGLASFSSHSSPLSFNFFYCFSLSFIPSHSFLHVFINNFIFLLLLFIPSHAVLFLPTLFYSILSHFISFLSTPASNKPLLPTLPHFVSLFFIAHPPHTHEKKQSMK